MDILKRFFVLGAVICLSLPVGCNGGGEPITPKAQNPDPSLQPASRDMGGGEETQTQGALELE